MHLIDNAIVGNCAKFAYTVFITLTEANMNAMTSTKTQLS